MLNYLCIRNFAIVEFLELEFKSGLIVITGETGAGKSILLDALGLILGDRADLKFVRAGNHRAEITAGFDPLGAPLIHPWLEQHALDDNGECIIRRIIGNDGRSKAFINNQAVPINALKELGEQLVDIHGQHQHQSLLKKTVQRQGLDDFATHNVLLHNISKLYKEWQKVNAELKTLTESQTDKMVQSELITYQVEELRSLDLQQNEFIELETTHKRLANAKQLSDDCQTVLNSLDEDDSIALVSNLENIHTKLNTMLEFDQALAEPTELIKNATILLHEAVHDLKHYQSNSVTDSNQLQQIEQRLSLIYDLARKHKMDAHNLQLLLPELEKQLANLSEKEQRVCELQKQNEMIQNQYFELATKLNSSRKIAAEKLGKKITQNMQKLGMKGGKFEVLVSSLENNNITPFGADKIEFAVSINPGHPLLPLNKVASGGELSRISLAIQIITAQATALPTLIFDEVDVGVGGGTAEIVGLELVKLSKNRQIICVTHLPQVAALGSHHLRVSKQSTGKTTHTNILPIAKKDRVDEIARMLGGIEITKQTLSHAKEMLKRSSEHYV